MAKYIFKRTLQSLLSVFIVVFVVFLLLRLMPTDGYFTRDDYQNMSEAERQMYLVEIGAVGNPLKLFERFGSHLLGYPVLLAVVFAVMYLLLRVLRLRTAVPAGK